MRWGWFYLSTILDDYSRYVIGWKLCGTMRAEDVTDTLDIALAASGCDSAKGLHKPRLPRDTGSPYIAGDLAQYLEDKGMKHLRGASRHLLPGRRLLAIAERAQTQGKIDRWHQTLKNRILLENYFLESELQAAIAAFIDHDNTHRFHESIGNLTPADVYFGRGETILAERRRIKLQTIQNRRFNHQRQAP
jgi:putative transposase